MARKKKATPADDTAAQTNGPDAVSNPPSTQPAAPARKYPRWVYPAAAATAVVSGGAVEMQTSFLQSQVFHKMAEGRLFSRTRTSSTTVQAPAIGPYDERLGYTQSLRFRERLTERGFEVTSETTWTERSIAGLDLYPIYNSRAQAGLNITDDTNHTVYSAQYPSRSFADYDAIPPMLANSLLFVENRELMRDQMKTWNPAIEWVRLASAFAGQGLRVVGMPQDRAGGSTLATQIEKFRHSPGGVTGSAPEKLRQMLTASVRAYEHGTDTRRARQEIVLDYLNSMPLAAYPGFGEVNGFADGMSLWFGADMNEVNRLLRTPNKQLSEAELDRKAVIYRQSVSLVMAVKKPSAYLRREREELTARVDAYLPLLAEAGIISPAMRDRVLQTPLVFTDPATHERLRPQPPSKPIQGLRIELLKALGVHDLYTLNRLDVAARTTMDGRVNDAVTARLQSLKDPETAAKNGVLGYRLLAPGMLQDVTYSFNLYERMPDGTNVLRVQTDNYNGALNLNEGSKLELGSTAKLRTMSTYLLIVSELHARYKDMTPEQLAAQRQNDPLTKFAVAHMAAADTDKSLNGILNAAMDRKYSGNPGERFFTGGGVHSFVNFDGWENGRSFTVRESFQHSVNLPFVRMMRDIRDYVEADKMNIDPAIFTDASHPQRREYLEKFAQQEGALFMYRAYARQRDLPPEQLASHLAAQTRRTPVQLAVIYRSLHPNAPLAAMETFIRAECENKCGDGTDFQKLYDSYGRDKFNLNDRAYLTKIHPMAIWLSEQRVANPKMTWDDALKGSTRERVEIYSWLLNSKNMGGQNNRIHTILEEEAFTHIHAYWAKMGFPFDRMVPSLASALGASGDTPAALASLAGIIQNDGLNRGSMRFREITLAPNTPYQLNFRKPAPQPQRVLPAEATRIIRDTMYTVVENGTAVRARGSVKLSDGTVLPLGGKTGTGDNREGDTVKSRTATFVFVIDNRFYGTITAFVDGPSAAKYRFTSSLASQIFKTIVTDIQPVLDRSYAITPKYVEPPPAPVAPAAPPVAPAPVAAAPATPAPRPKPVETAEAAPPPPAATPADAPAAPEPTQTPAATPAAAPTAAPPAADTPAGPAPEAAPVTAPAPEPVPAPVPEQATPADAPAPAPAVAAARTTFKAPRA